MRPKRFVARRVLRFPLRVIRGGARRAFWLTLRTGGRLLHPVIGPRAPIGGLATIDDAAAHGRLRRIDLDPAREVRYGPGPAQTFTATPTFCATLPNARVIGPQGAVVSSGNRLVADVSPVVAAPPWRHAQLMRGLLPAPTRLAGQTAVIASVLAHRYYHWMFDILPRLDLIARAHLSFDRVIAQVDLKTQRETLEMLGLRADQIVAPGEGTHWLCENLIAPSLPTPFATPTREVCGFLRRTFRPESAGSDEGRRILFISRKDAARRRLVNEDEVAARLAKFGAEQVLLDGMSVAEQATLFAQAKLVIGPHGAGFTNMVFAPAGATLIEFRPDAFDNSCFEILAGLVDARYIGLPGRCSPAPELDMIVDPNAVEQAVEGLLLRS